MSLVIRAISEDTPGPVWSGLFRDYWPAYAKWWARDGLSSRPTYLECRNALSEHMPEIAELYQDLCDLAGGGDMQARFLSFYCPPRYSAACSQAVWPGKTPLLVRNYDYDPNAFDAIVLKTRWNGRGVIGTSDGLFGLVDGINDAGLTVSLTFGGRREIGDGFGVPLILRYILQTCTNVDEAAAILKRVPCHMSYNVTALDADRRFLTAYLAPDKPAVVTHSAVATNHQERVDGATHARYTASVERERFLLQRLSLHPETQERFIGAFLKPPLYSNAFSSGFGTLYTAAYRPDEKSLELRWPGRVWKKSFANFETDHIRLLLPSNPVSHQVVT